MFLSLFASSIYLGIICLWTNEPFVGFSPAGWGVLLIQAVICQLTAWFLISYATQNMKATRVSLSLLGQAILTALIAFFFLDELLTPQMLIGGIILLFGIRITFFDKTLSLKRSIKS
jgi:drug/metabolite transporter (DMT)-like permease